MALDEWEAAVEAANDFALDDLLSAAQLATPEIFDEFGMTAIPSPEPIAYPERDNIEVGLNSDNSLVILKWGPVMTAGITAGQARKLAHLLHNCAAQVRGRK